MECVFVTLIFCVAGICFLAIWVYQNARDARLRYFTALERLKYDPKNDKRREEAFDAGRRWVNLAYVMGERVTEETIRSDIKAAMGESASEMTLLQHQNGKEAVRPPAERLAELDELRRKGLITENEYQMRRAEVLRSI